MLAVYIANRSIGGFYFDDAEMFVRYALHVRSGDGISWNPGGPHTAGLTSPLWLIPVLLGTFSHLSSVSLLVGLSSAFGIIALLTLSEIVRSAANTPWLSRFETTFVLITLPLLATAAFTGCMTNGMETMLGLFLICLLAAGATRFCISQTTGSALVLAVIGLACVLTRPESGICVVTLPMLMWIWDSDRSSKGALFTFLAAFAVGAALLLVLNRWYFGTYLPLPFYVKQLHGYAGRTWFPNPLEYLFNFMSAVLPAIILLICFVEQSEWKKTAIYLVPLGMTIVYLFTVMQVMGVDGRYYMPYLPLLYIPAIRRFDAWCSSGRFNTPGPVRFAAVLLLPVLLWQLSAFSLKASQHVLRHGKIVYREPELQTQAKSHLPWLGWSECNQAFARYARSLPGRPRFALTEAGLVGTSVPDSFVLDMVGLNDRYIALHGPAADYIFGQQLDVIWLPESSYTWLRGNLYSDPRLLQNYDVYAGAFNYGMAIRRQSPLAAKYKEQLARIWQQIYPGSTPEEYQVQSVVWDSTRQRL